MTTKYGDVMSSNEKNDDGSYLEVAESNPNEDEESCLLWRLKNEQQYEQYRLELNTRGVLEAEAQIKLYIDTAVSSPEKMASVGMDCVVRSAITLQEYSDTFTSDLPSMVKQLRSHCTKLNPEKTLIAQSVTLDGIFNALATQAACVGWNTNTDKAEKLLRLAFKAQAQCAKTLQVVLQNELAKKINRPNELLVNDCGGESNGSKKMDSTAETGAIPNNSTVAALVCIEGGKN
jgi:hypothetical protein